MIYLKNLGMASKIAWHYSNTLASRQEISHQLLCGFISVYLVYFVVLVSNLPSLASLRSLWVNRPFVAAWPRFGLRLSEVNLPLSYVSCFLGTGPPTAVLPGSKPLQKPAPAHTRAPSFGRCSVGAR